MTTAAIYTRISKDRKKERAGVERQRVDCEAICAREGWTDLRYYEDDDRSAYSGRERPRYQQLLSDVARGEVNVVVAWHSDRLWRDVIEQQTFLGIGRSAGLKLVATMATNFDPADADDAFMSTLLTAVAQKESADKSRRIGRKMRELAEQGKSHGGPRPFGLSADRTEVVPAEADAVRDAATRVLRGESVGAIAREWNSQGITTSTGDTWTTDRLRKTLARPSIAGLVEHRGKVIDSEAKWPAVLDVETWERVVALFKSRALGPRSAPARSYLLGAGVSFCGACGARLRAMHRGPGRSAYVCRGSAHGGCGGVSIKVERADAEVARRVFDHVESAAFARIVARELKAATKADSRIAQASDALLRDRARQDELADDFADGVLDRDQYLRQKARLADRIEVNELTLRETETSTSILAIDRDALREDWPGLTLDERRAVLAALGARVTIAPTGMQTVPVADRVKVAWVS